MTYTKNIRCTCAIVALLAAALGAAVSPAYAAATLWQAPQADQQPAIQKQVGAIKSIVGNTVTITTDSGATTVVNVQPTTKIVRVEPGQTDLKSAVSLDFKDLQIGDRIFVRWKASDTVQPVNAIGIIAMKRADVDAKQEHQREDWQKRGAGGLVTSVDPAARSVVISVTSIAGKKSITVNTTAKTVFRRYAPDSVRFDDAQPSSLAQIKPGDQLRALGTRSADGSTVDAEEVVTGSFRNIAGNITAIDAAAKSITVMDLITKKPVVVKISDQTQLRKLPPEIAQRIALRLRAAAAGISPGANGSSAAGGAAGNAAGNGNRASASGSASGSASPGAGGPPPPPGMPPPPPGPPPLPGMPPSGGQTPGFERGAGNGPPGAGGPGGGRLGGGHADFQQILSRMPAASLGDFQKGDSVMAVSTEGTDSAGVTAITLVGGVDSILEAAAASGSQMMTLSPWSLGGSSSMESAGGNP